MRIAICDSDKACRQETRKVCIEYFGNQNINIEIFEDSSGGIQSCLVIGWILTPVKYHGTSICIICLI